MVAVGVGASLSILLDVDDELVVAVGAGASLLIVLDVDVGLELQLPRLAAIATTINGNKYLLLIVVLPYFLDQLQCSLYQFRINLEILYFTS